MKKRNIKQVALAITLIGVFGNAQAKKKQEKINEELFQAIADDKAEDFRTALKEGAQVKARENWGMKDNQTPLTLAASLRYPDFVRILIDKKADVNATTKDGTTALMLAADTWPVNISPRGEETVTILIKAGANIHAKNNKGQTALSLARKARNTKIEQLLIEAGAK